MAIDRNESVRAVAHDSPIRERTAGALSLPTETSRSRATQMGAHFAGVNASTSNEALSVRGALQAPMFPIKKARQTGVVLSELWSGMKAGTRAASQALFEGKTSVGGAVDVWLHDFTKIERVPLIFIRPVLATFLLPAGAIGGAVIGYINGLRKYPWKG